MSVQMIRIEILPGLFARIRLITKILLTKKNYRVSLYLNIRKFINLNK